MRFLGIDPGTAITGFGVIESVRVDHFRCIDFGTIRSEGREPMVDRLKTIYTGVCNVIDTHSPDIMALEDIFYGRNVQAALKLGQVRGIVMLAGSNAGIAVVTLAARAVKQSLTGYGGASKEQVQRMVKEILHLHSVVNPLDASDALAIALCQAQRWWTEQKLKNSK